MKILLTAINSKYIHSNLAVRYLKKFTERLESFLLMIEMRGY